MASIPLSRLSVGNEATQASREALSGAIWATSASEASIFHTAIKLFQFIYGRASPTVIASYDAAPVCRGVTGWYAAQSATKRALSASAQESKAGAAATRHNACRRLCNSSLNIFRPAASAKRAAMSGFCEASRVCMTRPE